jgi:4,5-DOPA dioxygenase extradiol
MQKMPVLFVGHGSPMNAIEENEYSRSWSALGQVIPTPKAILCISAHWETPELSITASEQPRMIYDFMGFPPELYAVNYPAPGDSNLAQRIIDTLATPVLPDHKWGLDHGSWSILCKMYPKANIPVLQLSLPYTRDGAVHYEIGKQLRFLRDEGVLILGSGNVVHNLGRMVWEDQAFDWAVQFDAQVKESILQHDHQPLIQYQNQGQAARLAINSAEHYLPLLYILGASQPDDQIQFYNEKIWGGSLSMRCVQFG